MTEDKKPPHLNVISFNKVPEEILEENLSYYIEYTDNTYEIIEADGLSFYPGINFVFFVKEGDGEEMDLDLAINLDRVKYIQVKQ